MGIEAAIMYDSDRKYKNRFSYWYNKIKGIKELKIPQSKIIAVPFEVFSIFAEEYEMNSARQLIENFVTKSIIPEMSEARRWFIKNGCFSNKFDFRNCISDESKIIKDFIDIQNNSAFHETGGMSEFILREVIPWDNQTTATIYHGMPLRTEVRVFYDFGNREVMYAVNYWDYETVRPKLCNRTDVIVFEATHSEMKDGYFGNVGRVEKAVTSAMQSVDLQGRWSIDVLVDSVGGLWLIDMAIAESSAYWRSDKKELSAVEMYETEVQKIIEFE